MNALSFGMLDALEVGAVKQMAKDGWLRLRIFCKRSRIIF